MAMGSMDMTTVTLIPGNLVMTQGTDMPIFHITKGSFGNKTFQNGKNGLQMVVVMKRKITSEMMTTYFPSLLLTAITFATTFFKPFFFEEALRVNLTTMLVMTTIFISKMEGLSATKMIDYWLILCQLVPFAQVVLLTLMESLREKEQEENVALEKDQIQLCAAVTNNSKADVEKDTNPREAWTNSAIKLSKAGSLTMLTRIGEVLISFLISNNHHFRKECAATYCALCFNDLLCNCCEFLFLNNSL